MSTGPRGADAGHVVCVGGAVVDRSLHLLAPAVARTSNPARSVASFGGVARNVAENLARLGVDVSLVSCVGDDPAGLALLGHTEDAGVDVTAVRRVPGATTAEYVAVLAPDGDLVLGVAAADVLGEVGAADLARVLAAGGAGWVLLDCNLSADVLVACLAACRAAGVRVGVEAVSTAKVVRLPHDLAGVDLLFGNADEVRALVGADGQGDGHDGDDDVARGAALLARGAAAVVLTRGARPPLLLDASGAREVPVVTADVVDVTGAGDALVAGTLAGLVHGLTTDAAVAAGVRIAALTVASERTVRPDLTPEHLHP